MVVTGKGVVSGWHGTLADPNLGPFGGVPLEFAVELLNTVARSMCAVDCAVDCAVPLQTRTPTPRTSERGSAGLVCPATFPCKTFSPYLSLCCTSFFFSHALEAIPWHRSSVRLLSLDSSVPKLLRRPVELV
jgi:hypothetical protein